MSAGHLARHGSGLACGGSAPPGCMARSSFYAMTWPARRAAAGKGRPKPAISDQALLVAIGRPGGIALGGRGLPKVWARPGLSRHPGCPQAGARLMRENNLLSPHRCRRRGGNPHDGEIITHAPNLMWARWRSGVHGGRRLGLDLHRRRAWNAECVGWHGKRGDRFAALQPISMGLPGCMARPRPARLGGWPCGWITAPSICRTTSPTRSRTPLGHPAVLRLRRRAPDQRRRRAVQSHAGTDHPWSRHLRNIAELRDAVRDFVELYNPVDRRKERLRPEPRSSSRRGTPRSNQARRVRQTCVQEPGALQILATAASARPTWSVSAIVCRSPSFRASTSRRS